MYRLVSLALACCLLSSACSVSGLLVDLPTPLGGAVEGVWELTEMNAERGLTALPMTNRITLVALAGVPTRFDGEAFSGPYRIEVWIEEDGEIDQLTHATNGRLATIADRHTLPLRYRSLLSTTMGDSTRQMQQRREQDVGYVGRVGSSTENDPFENVGRLALREVPRALAETEAEYFRLWEFVRRVQVEEGELRLYDHEDELLMRFERPAGESRRLPWEPKRG